jgi:hypothetical protein
MTDFERSEGEGSALARLGPELPILRFAQDDSKRAELFASKG